MDASSLRRVHFGEPMIRILWSHTVMTSAIAAYRDEFGIDKGVSNRDDHDLFLLSS